MTTYDVDFRDDAGSEDATEITADTEDEARDLARDACENWVRGGEWGTEGASVVAWYTLHTCGGDEDNCGCDDVLITVEIEPEHAALIHTAVRDARGQYAAYCGDDPDTHQWTADGEGGCSENPGVWSHGGTTMSFADHCSRCGLHRYRVQPGSQRNPGEHDRVEYQMESGEWCVEHQRFDCRAD